METKLTEQKTKYRIAGSEYSTLFRSTINYNL